MDVQWSCRPYLILCNAICFFFKFSLSKVLQNSEYPSRERNEKQNGCTIWSCRPSLILYNAIYFSLNFLCILNFKLCYGFSLRSISVERQLYSYKKIVFIILFIKQTINIINIDVFSKKRLHNLF